MRRKKRWHQERLSAAEGECRRSDCRSEKMRRPRGIVRALTVVLTLCLSGCLLTVGASASEPSVDGTVASDVTVRSDGIEKLDLDGSDKANGLGGFDDYIEQMKDILPPSLAVSDAGSAADMLGMDALLAEISRVVSGSSGEIGSFFMLVVGAAVLMCLAPMLANFGGCTLAVNCVCSVAVLSRLLPMVEEIGARLGELNSFFAALIPISVGVCALGGGEATAAAHSAGMTLTMQVYSSVCGAMTVLVAAIFLLGAIGSADDGAGTLAKGVKGFFNGAMGILTLLFSATLSLQTVLTSCADSAAMRMAKYSASGMIPLVGGAVSGALATVAGGLSYAKGVVGGGAVCAIVMMALPPLVLLLLYKLCLSLALLLVDYCACADGARTLRGLVGGLDALISVYALTSVIYLIEVVLFIMGGASL